jgi:two-component system, chemotaxis family, response regulator Rcp1
MHSLLNAGKPIEILLVEDSPEEAEWTMESLKDGRVRNRIHWVEDGEEAMAFLRRQGRYAAVPRPDLILLDLHMPRMGGLEVLAAVKQAPDLRRIPVVIMTSSADEQDVLRAYDRHANCYVTKPIDIDKFMEAVRGIEEFWLSIVHLPAA